MGVATPLLDGGGIVVTLVLDDVDVVLLGRWSMDSVGGMHPAWDVGSWQRRRWGGTEVVD